MFIETLIKLIFGHAIADCALQTPLMGQYKNRQRAFYNDNGEVPHFWFFALSAHALVNGAVVWLITQNTWLGVAETVAHFITDYLSSNGHINFITDQMLHLIAKVVWACLAVYLIT